MTRGQVSSDAVYSELYKEGRYFRRHELTVGTWYTIILLAILGAIITVKSGDTLSNLYNLFLKDLIKIFTAIIVIFIGGSGMYSVYYSGVRYKNIRERLNTLEPKDKEFKKTKIPFNPRHCVLLTLFVLTIITVGIIYFN